MGVYIEGVVCVLYFGRLAYVYGVNIGVASRGSHSPKTKNLVYM